MNEQDLKTVFNKLSAQAESIRRMQDVSKQIEKLDYWIKTLKEKVAEIVALGAVPVVDITARLSALEAEKKDLQSMLIPASAAEIRALVAGTGPTRAPVPEPVWKDPLSEKDSAEMNALLHVIATTDLSDWEQEERWYQYESWACNWRIVVAKYSKEIHDRSPLLKEVYGKLRDIMRVYSPQLWYIQALDRKATLDWVDRLVECEETKDRLIRDRKNQIRNQEDAQEMALLVLKEAVREYREAPEEAMAEAQRKLKHCIREAARYRHLREEIGEIVAHLRTMLEGDFAFLWPKDEVVEESPATTLSNREIASRMMRRMKSKTLIGACHGPFDQIYKGFPEHDKGRAKILLQDLCRVGVVRAKYAQIGIRVSIEPKMMPIADKLIDMQDTGMESLESLMGEARV